MPPIRHFTATTIVVYQQKALLHLHKKLDKWLPVGGHIDENELPEEAALREVKEETGLEVELYLPAKDAEDKVSQNPARANPDVKYLNCPMHFLLEDIGLEPSFHQHMDFIFYAKADTFKLNPQDGETQELRWFSAKELTDSKEIPIEVKKMALEAIQLMKNY